MIWLTVRLNKKYLKIGIYFLITFKWAGHMNKAKQLLSPSESWILQTLQLDTCLISPNYQPTHLNIEILPFALTFLLTPPILF